MTAESDRSDAAHWASLINAIALRQDRDAFVALFNHFAGRVKAFLRRSGLSEARADELAQETMLAVWRKADRFDPASSGAAAWIFTIARNLRIDAARREGRGPAVAVTDAEFEFQVDEGPQPDVQVAALEVESRVRVAMSSLPPDQRRVVQMSFFDETAHSEIARVLNIPLGTVKSRLRLAMGRLRNLLGDLP